MRVINAEYSLSVIDDDFRRIGRRITEESVALWCSICKFSGCR